MPKGSPWLLLFAACAAPEVTPPREAEAVAAPLASPVAPGPRGQERFFDWTSLATAPGAGRARRDRLADALTAAGGGVFLAPSRTGRSHGGTFRQLDDFMYFTGLELPDSILAIDAEARTAELFAPRRDERFESDSRPNDFPGRPLADDPEIARVADLPVRPLEDLDRAMARWIADGRRLWIDLGPGPLGARAKTPATAWTREYTPEEALLLHLRERYSRVDVHNAFEAVARLRMVKSEAEIEVLRRAAAITCDGIRRAAAHIAPGIDERALEAELEAGFKRGGAQRLAFDSIIKSGLNSLWPWRVLAAHYDRRNRQMRAGELVVFDVGCEFEGYSSDVGRTFPVSGRFTGRQRELLEMEVAVADAIVAAVRPGVTLAELTEVARAATPEAARRYMQTGLFFGHHIGLAVGDPNLPEARLEPGMVFTVEPWYYDHGEGLAVFTEDIVVVTADGCEVLTAELPRDPDGLERLMRR